MSSGGIIQTLSPNTSKSVESWEKVMWNKNLGSVSATARVKKSLLLLSLCGPDPCFLAMEE